MSGSMSFNNLSSLSSMNTSMSFTDLNAEMNKLNQPNSMDSSNNSTDSTTLRTARSTLSGLGNMSNRNGEDGTTNNKPFGLGKTIVKLCQPTYNQWQCNNFFFFECIIFYSKITQTGNNLNYIYIHKQCNYNFVIKCG